MMSLQHIVGFKTAFTRKSGVELYAVCPVMGGEGQSSVRVRHGSINALLSFFDGITPDDIFADNPRKDTAASNAHKDTPIGAGGMSDSVVLGGFRQLGGLLWQLTTTTAEGIGITSRTMTNFNNVEYGLESTAHGCQSRRERQTRLRSRT